MTSSIPPFACVLRNWLFAMVAGAVVALMAVPARADSVTIDFETDSSGSPLQAGQVIDDEFAGWGVHVSALNYTGADLAIIFDTANPTGGDDDLATPGYHPSNTLPLDNALILAERFNDGNGDELDDNPDDEGSRPAGYIRFDFDYLMLDLTMTLIDIEESGGSIKFYLDGVNQGSVPIPSMGDNSVQTIATNDYLFDAMKVKLAGSGAIAYVHATAVPLPPAVWAGLALLGGLGIGRRIRRARRA